MNNKPTYLSKDGLEKLRAELDEMVSVKRPEVANRIHDAKEHGDLSENAEYEDAKNEQAFVEGRIQTLEALIKNATIIDENHSTDHVQIGSTVVGRERRRQGALHDRRLGRGQAGRGPDLEREPGRARPARQEEGREGRRPRPRRRLHLQDRRHQLAARGASPWTGLTSSRRRSGRARRSSTTRRRRRGRSTSAACAARSSSTSSPAPCARNGVETTLLYGVDDLDPMDAQALLTPDAIDREMGRPLAHVPDPAGDCHASYARHFAGIFIDIFAGLGIHPDRYYWMSDIYPTGAMDPYIRLALDRAALVREIYRRVANVQHPDTWHPLGVICPTCGKVGTTIVTAWDGERVYYECRAELVDLGARLRHVRLDQPVRRGGQAALEPGVGGAVVALRRDDRAGRQGPLDGRRVARPERRDRPRGLRARAAAQRPVRVPQHRRHARCRRPRAAAPPRTRSPRSIPPEQLRFLFLRPRPNQAIEFDPEGTDAIPRLFDEFDRFAAATAGREVKGELPPGFEATFRYSLLDPEADVAAEAAAFRPAFAHLAMLLQIPGVDVAARIEAEKGSPLTDRERGILDKRVAAARAWLDGYAPDAAKLAVQRDALPDAADTLSAEQRRFLAELSMAAGREAPTGGDAWQSLIFAAAAKEELPARRAFEAIYLAFLGRPNGPRAGWLLASLEPEFVLCRLGQAAGAAQGGAS